MNVTTAVVRRVRPRAERWCAHDRAASRDEHLLRLAEASGIDGPSCTAGNCIEKGCRRAVVYRKVA